MRRFIQQVSAIAEKVYQQVSALDEKVYPAG